MIERLSLQSFKAFDRFQITFRPVSILVGPNNAGKSTAIAALRAAAGMIRMARRVKPSQVRDDGDESYRAYPFRSSQFGIEDENLRYEFQPAESRFEVRISGGIILRAVWPEADIQDSFFYVTTSSTSRIRSSDEARNFLPQIGTIPILSPVEHNEERLSPKYVAETLSGRLASRHFRNQLLLLQQNPQGENNLAAFMQFERQWLADYPIDPPATRMTEEGAEIDVYYQEGRTPKEIVWAGDGVQVFLQLLLHLFRLRNADAIILDEPDVYLHADLQRRLLRLLTGLGKQIIFATHSTEMIVEAPPDAVIWMDRSRRRGIVAPNPATASQLAESIGSQFNLRLARALRVHLVVFVEGKDMKMLRNLAETVGADAFVTETRMAVIAMEGSTNWTRLEGFEWIATNFLEGALRGYVLLDRDYHSAAAINKVEGRLKQAGLDVHVWHRNELESYLLEAPAIARVSGAPGIWVDETLAEITDEMQEFVLSRMVSARHEDRVARRMDVAEVTEACARELKGVWKDPEVRIHRCPAKEVLSALNSRLKKSGYRTINAFSLSQAIQESEVADEMAGVLRRLNKLAS